jgi:hypothetical protein
VLTSPSSNVVPFQPPKQSERFVRLRHSLLNSTAWQSLPLAPRAVYVEMARRYNGKNNGQIPFSTRDGAEVLPISKDTVGRALKLLEQRNLAVCRSRGSFDRKTREAKAPEWELPEYNSLVSPEGPTGITTGTSEGLSGITTRTLLDKDKNLDLGQTESLPRISDHQSSPSPYQDIPPPDVPPGYHFISFKSPDWPRVENWARRAGWKQRGGGARFAIPGGWLLTDAEYGAAAKGGAS